MLCCVVRVSTHRTFTNPRRDMNICCEESYMAWIGILRVQQLLDGGTLYFFADGEREGGYFVYCPPPRPISEGSMPLHPSKADYFNHVFARLVRDVGKEISRIKVSVQEWSILKEHCLLWLDGAGSVTFKRPNPFMTNGRLGTFRGIPVHVDAEYIDDLPSRPNPG